MVRSWVLSLLWPGKHIILLATAASLLGGVTVIFVAEPRYLATARVTMDYVKPDPMTGRYMASKNVDAYVVSQVKMITDYQVTIPAVGAMGLLDSPDIAGAYESRPSREQQMEYTQWVASRVMSAANASIIPDSNILQVEYRGNSPDFSLSAVEALRQAYIQANVELRRQSARARANGLARRADELRANVARTQRAKAEFERANGVTLTQGEHDPDSLQLRRLATSVDAVGPAPLQRSASSLSQLQDIDSRIAAQTQSLGPNNPQLLAMQRSRDVLRARVAAEQAAFGSIGSAIAARAGVQDRLIDQQKAKVLENREKMLQLRLFQDEINRDSNAASKAMEESVSMRQMANAGTATVSSVGEAKVEPKPVFPNIPLILGGTGALGLILGSLLTLLRELLSRRVRSIRDLQLASQMPILGIVPRVRRANRVRPPRPPRLVKVRDARPKKQGKPAKPIAARGPA